jgi:hypothetical protein
MLATACPETDVSYLVANTSIDDWSAILELIARALRYPKTGKRCIPSIDHRRIEKFVEVWNSAVYQDAIRNLPQFCNAISNFSRAWQQKAFKPQHIPAPTVHQSGSAEEENTRQSATLPAIDNAIELPAVSREEGTAKRRPTSHPAGFPRRELPGLGRTHLTAGRARAVSR